METNSNGTTVAKENKTTKNEQKKEKKRKEKTSNDEKEDQKESNGHTEANAESTPQREKKKKQESNGSISAVASEKKKESKDKSPDKKDEKSEILISVESTSGATVDPEIDNAKKNNNPLPAELLQTPSKGKRNSIIAPSKILKNLSKNNSSNSLHATTEPSEKSINQKPPSLNPSLVSTTSSNSNFLRVSTNADPDDLKSSRKQKRLSKQLVDDISIIETEAHKKIVETLERSDTKTPEPSTPRSNKKRTSSKLHIKLQHKRNMLGEVVFKDNPSWVLMLNIQTGIRHVVGKSAAVIPEDESSRIQDIDTHPDFFKSPKILRFPPEGSSETQPHKTGLFKFKDYCPLVFRHLRQKCGIDPADYMVSLCNTLENGENALRLLPTPGKSGSLFFFSHDMKYIVKTVPKSEAHLLKSILPHYYRHVMENPNTLLPMFYGLHTVKPHKHRRVRFVVMGNVFETSKKLQERFDLKGSTLGRAASAEEKASFKENVTYKDLDWLSAGMKLFLGSEKKKLFVEQLKADCELLEKLNIMDYSLLVGIHVCDEESCSLACEEAKYKRENEEKEKKQKEEKEKKERKEKREKKQKTKEKETKEEKEKKEKDSNSNNTKKSPKEESKKEKSKEETKKEETKKEETKKEETKKEKSKEESKKEESKKEETKKEVKKTEETTKEGKKEIEEKEKNARNSNVSHKNTLQLSGVSENTQSMVQIIQNNNHNSNGNGHTNRSDTFSSKKAIQTNYPLPSKFNRGQNIYRQDDGGMQAVDKAGKRMDIYYYVGVIDILMTYSIRKKAEHAYKSLRFKSEEASSVNPKEYSQRFQKFIEKNII